MKTGSKQGVRCSCLLLVAFVLITGMAAADVFVSPQGSDANPGTQDKPFASLEAARDAIRALKANPLPAGGVTVWLQGGDYPRTNGFELTATDSGTPESPIVYRAAEKQTVRLLGGRALSGLTPVADPAILSRLDEKARGNVLSVDLKALGVTDFGQLRSRGFGRSTTPAHLELFFAGKPMTLARWPNEGQYEKIASIPTDRARDDDHGGKIGDLKAGFFYAGDRPKQWKSLDDIWVHGYWAWDWANSYEKVESIDRETRLIKTLSPYGLYGFRPGQRFYYLNILEELDEPGEYFVDRATGLLYFWPPADPASGETLVSLIESPLVTLKDASSITLRGLIFEAARGNALTIEGGAKNTVAGCSFRQLGNYALQINGGLGHQIVSCDISYTGDGGVELSGGDRKTLTPCGHAVENCHIHHFARWNRILCPAILADGVGMRFAHNLLHDAPHTAILFSGNELVIECNEIHTVCMETGDAGAIYTGRDYTFRGNVVRHNFIHHMGGVGMGTMGVYNDDCVSGTVMFGNVFWHVQRAAFLGGGRDFRVENNIFVDCTPAVALDGRGLSPAPVWHDMVYQTMKQSLEAMNWRQPPYSTRYPELADLVPYYAKTDGIPPGNILVAHNISVGGQWTEIGWGATPDMARFQDNLVGQDPGFVDAVHGNFELKPDSPAWKLGFQPLPLRDIGPRQATERK